jgi:hypothetical protein
MLAYSGNGLETLRRLVWRDREGKQTGVFGPDGYYADIRLSPDEMRVVFSDRTKDLYILESSAAAPRRLTFPDHAVIDDPPLWSPDGKQVVWASNRSGAFDLWIKAANGASAERVLVPMGTPSAWPEDWSRDGRYLMYEIPGDKSGEDLWAAPQGMPDAKPFAYLNTAADERHGRFSPNGRWAVYSSNETGRSEVFIQSFPKPGVKYQVSTQGGVEPEWRSDGAEIFFIQDRTLMAVNVKLPGSESEAIEFGSPKALFPLSVVDSFVGRSYEAGRDGQRFLTPAHGDGPAPSITVVMHWQMQLTR